jgi:hypothetical protein
MNHLGEAHGDYPNIESQSCKNDLELKSRAPELVISFRPWQIRLIERQNFKCGGRHGRSGTKQRTDREHARDEKSHNRSKKKPQTSTKIGAALASRVRWPEAIKVH